MDSWKFYDVTHRDHVVCNPTSAAKLDELIALLDLPPGPGVLDVGTGKGEFLLRTAERYGGTGGAGFRAVAVDPSPYFLRVLREAAARRLPAASLEVIEAGGADYDAPAESFDLAVCLGASFAFAGYGPTLDRLSTAVRPGGLLLVGEPFWARDPDPAYLASSGMGRDDFGTHEGNVEAGVARGLVPLLALVSSGDDWDRYETLQWRAAARYAARYPGDPDVPEILERVERARHEYLAWGRETVGWAIYLFGRR